MKKKKKERKYTKRDLSRSPIPRRTKEQQKAALERAVALGKERDAAGVDIMNDFRSSFQVYRSVHAVKVG